MKNIEITYREILYQAIEKNNRKLTQAELSRKLGFSLSTVNRAVRKLSDIGAVKIKLRSFDITDIKKILYFWSSIRNLQKDIVYSTRADIPVREIEKLMPDNIVFGGYSAYKYIFKDVPADYSEVYIYADENNIKKRFPESKGVPNIFVLKKDSFINNYGKTTTKGNTFVDLWNLKEWYAKEFIKSMEEKIHGILE